MSRLISKPKNTPMKNLLYILPFLFVISSCHEAANYEKAYSEETLAEGEPIYTNQSAMESLSDIKVEDRKIIWTGSLTYQVKNVDSSTKFIQQLAKDKGAFISDMNFNTSNYRISNTIEIRVDSKRFDELIEDLKKDAIYLENVNISSNDVTEEFIDVESRLASKKKVRDRYVDILENKTGDVKDIIEAEEAIRKITEEIEAKEGRLRYLKDQIKFSTISATIYQKVKYQESPDVYEKPFVTKLTNGLQNGWGIITGFILLLANIWPVIIIVAFLIWKRKWFRFRKKGDRSS